MSKKLGFEDKYTLIIEFDSERGKISGVEYTQIMNLKTKALYELLNQGFVFQEDARLFLDKLGDYVRFLELNKIPYFGFIGGSMHCFFNNEEKLKAYVEFVKKNRIKQGSFGIGLKRKYFLDNFEIKIIQRVKFRQDPNNKFNSNKIIDSSDFFNMDLKSDFEKRRINAIQEIEKEIKESENKIMNKEQVEKTEKFVKENLGEKETEEKSNIIREIEPTENKKENISEKGKLKEDEKNLINKIMGNNFGLK
jgi:hypothetical protein